MTRRFTVSILAAAAFAGLSSTTVLADSDGWFWGRGHMGEWFRGEMWRGGEGPGHMMMGRMMGRRFSEERLTALKTELAITTAQEEVWKTYVTTIGTASDAMMKTRQTMMDRSELKTLPERLTAQESIMAMHQENMKAVREATLALYGKLDDAQKKKADDLILGMGMM